MTDPDALAAEAALALAKGPDPALLARLHEAWRANPSHPLLTLRLADALQLAGQRDQAIAAYTAAIALDAMSFEAWYGLAGAHLSRGAHAAARDAAVQALGLAPHAEGARCLLAEALFGLGEVDAAAAAYGRVIERAEPAVRDSALASLAVLIPGSQAADHARVRAIRTAWITRAGGAIQPLPVRPAPKNRKIRIGYCSAFFGARNWMKPAISNTRTTSFGRSAAWPTAPWPAPSPKPNWTSWWTSTATAWPAASACSPIAPPGSSSAGSTCSPPRRCPASTP
jgi:tetratricopeptide (TPR) repeat protein